MKLRRSGLGWIASLALVAAIVVTGAGGATAPAGSRPASLGMLLRLHELPPGYLVDEEVGCGILDPEGTEPPLHEFIVEHWPRVCAAQYDRLYPIPAGQPDPPLLGTTVIDAHSVATANALQPMLAELLSRLTGNETPAERPPPASVGPETRLFRGSALVGGHGAPASIVSWREGSLIGASLVGGAGARANDRLALRFARLQGRHMRHPQPYPAKARDDVEVPLDNPRLQLPVYWLGRSLDLGDAEPLKLTTASSLPARGEAPENTRIELEYGGGLLRIGTWTAPGWRRYARTKLGRELFTWRCTQNRTIAVPGGSATIYRGYAKDYARCPQRPPRVFSALVRRGRVVLGLNLPLCYTCLETPLSAGKLEAVAEGLRLRPQRRFEQAG